MSATISTEAQDRAYMQLALGQARLSPPKPTNFCVGAVLVDPQSDAPILATGFTLEEPGNTHAEQCCFIKLARQYDIGEEDLGARLPASCSLYTTMEPCGKRSIGNLPCVDRILRLKRADGRPAIGTVYVGVAEPETFVKMNEGQTKLREAGINVVHVSGFEDEILKVATAGHGKENSKESEQQ